MKGKKWHKKENIEMNGRWQRGCKRVVEVIEPNNSVGFFL